MIKIGNPLRPDTRMQLMAMFLYPEEFEAAYKNGKVLSFYQRLSDAKKRYAKECMIELLEAKDNRLE